MTSRPHGTTIVAATFPGGVVMAGDRRATMGNIIAQRDIEKVFPADEYSAVGIAGTAGLAVELVRLFQTELEHYEKIEGMTLSLDGKANRLAGLIRGQPRDGHAGPRDRPAVRRIRPVREPGTDRQLRRHRRPLRGDGVPLVGSGSLFARGALKKLYRDGLVGERVPRPARPGAVRRGRDDSATGGPDLTRRISPMVLVITAEGCRRSPRRRRRRDRGLHQSPAG